MNDLESILALLIPGGGWGKFAFGGFCWYLAGLIGNLIYSGYLLRRFSREGPVIPLLLPTLEHKWRTALFGAQVWGWLRRMGFAALFISLIGSLVELGLAAHQTLAAGVVSPDWRIGLSDHFIQVNAILLLLAYSFGALAVLGGLAGLLSTRARNFITASSAMVSAADIERARRFIDEVQQFDAGELLAEAREGEES
jgi:hypothetical protein